MRGAPAACDEASSICQDFRLPPYDLCLFAAGNSLTPACLACLPHPQGEPSSSSAAAPPAPVAEQVQAYVAHIEQGFGEVVRRLEKKVDSVASLLDQNGLELLESRLAGGLVKMEGRLAAVEEAAAASHQASAQQPAAQEDASFRLLERVTAMEAAMAEQSRAVRDLLMALGAQGSPASQRLADAVAAAHTSMAAGGTAASLPSPLAKAAGGKQLDQAAAAAEKPGARSPAAKPAQAAAAAAAAAGEKEPAAVAAEEKEEQEAGQPAAAQLVQRKAAVARRSVLGDPRRAAASSSGGGPAAAGGSQRQVLTPRLQALHSAGTAQQIAMATARQQLALGAARAREEAEAEAPVWVTMFHVFGWGTLVLVGLAAVAVGVVAALLKSGQLTEADLAFLWEPRR